tara:strand:+ start:106 stop:426 length:321 start_codon:yes stop_codon:yes gene_type:complete
MKTLKSLFILCSLTIFLNSCAGLSDASKILRNEKVASTDEFLIEKKNPLILPPDYKTIPKPGSLESIVNKKKSNFEEILRNSKTKSNTSKSKASSTEQSIINQIKN